MGFRYIKLFPNLRFPSLPAMITSALKKLVVYLYRRNPALFWEIATEDMVGHIPATVREPSMEFLKTAGRKWESYLIWMSWTNQRRAMTDTKNAETYLGMLFFIRWLYHLATRSPVKEERREPPKVVEEEDPLIGVSDFLKGHGIKR